MSIKDTILEKWAYLLFLTPLFTDWVERGRLPVSSRELITEVVVGSLILFLVNLLYRNMQELKVHAETDGLTGLYNRRKFARDLEREVARAKRLDTSLALVYIDVDQFKMINDKYGHNGGDFVLTEVASLLQKSGRKDVDIFYRLGGDEFAILLPGADRGEAQSVVQRKLRMQHTYHYHLQKMGVTLSFGVAGLQSNESPQDLLKRADMAMYQSKHRQMDQSDKSENAWPFNKAAHL